MSLLYEIDYSKYEEKECNFIVNEKKITLFDLNIENEVTTYKTRILRLYFYLISKGKFKIFYVKDEVTGNIVHTSYVVGKCLKFGFMNPRDIQIGPCFTAETHRGKGIYRNVLNFINNSHYKNFDKVYMMVNENNTSSIKGIENAGFTKIGLVERNKILKTYRTVKN